MKYDCIFCCSGVIANIHKLLFLKRVEKHKKLELSNYVQSQRLSSVLVKIRKKRIYELFLLILVFAVRGIPNFDLLEAIWFELNPTALAEYELIFLVE